MIAYLKGVIASTDSYGILLDVGGVGYEIAMSTKALAGLPAVGSAALIWTYMQVKDDGVSLFGFNERVEKELFLRLIGVSGIGPKMALAALSTYSASQLSSIIAEGDVAAISRVSGIGKKTAQRVVLELQGILKADNDAVAPYGAEMPSAVSDASQALQAMGFSTDEVARALKNVSAEGKDASAVIREALKYMGGK